MRKNVYMRGLNDISEIKWIILEIHIHTAHVNKIGSTILAVSMPIRQTMFLCHNALHSLYSSSSSSSPTASLTRVNLFFYLFIFPLSLDHFSTISSPHSPISVFSFLSASVVCFLIYIVRAHFHLFHLRTMDSRSFPLPLIVSLWCNIISFIYSFICSYDFWKLSMRKVLKIMMLMMLVHESFISIENVRNRFV